jgi:thioredoxin
VALLLHESAFSCSAGKTLGAEYTVNTWYEAVAHKGVLNTIASRELLSGRFLTLLVVMVIHRNETEFDRLLSKHASETGLPVVVDFYSDSCGPCRMMAPVFKNLAQEIGQDKAVFVKVDTNAMYELSSRYQVRSLPTFMFFLNGKQWNQFAGAGEGQLRQMTQEVVRQSEYDNVLMTLDDFVSYYGDVDASKSRSDVESIYKKCADLTKPNPNKQCVGGGANQLGRKLKKKYGKAPKTIERFDANARKPSSDEAGEKPSSSSSSSKRTDQKSSSANNKPNLHLASKDELKAELERRLDEERDAQVEAEDEDEDEPSGLESRWKPGPFPEQIVIVGGGPGKCFSQL